jgi:metacaspase-1
MPKGLSLHIGLNALNPKAYSGWPGTLAACEFDARDMRDLAKKQGFKPTMRLTKAATRNRVLADLKSAAGSLKKGDMFLLTYSGHGGQVPNTGNDFEADGNDETWCLYDGELIDDELYDALSAFVAGVRILILSDSCHSGTVAKALALAAHGAKPLRSRAMPRDIAMRVYLDNAEFYDKLQARSKGDPRTKAKATGLLISGCQDNQESSDGDRNGLFTATLMGVWRGGKFQGDYRGFHKTILKFMPPIQTPNYFTIGPANHAFEAQKPFTL